MVNKKDELKKWLEKLNESKLAVKETQEKSLAYNKEFNQWIQDTLGIEETRGELHLAEILSLWDSV